MASRVLFALAATALHSAAAVEWTRYDVETVNDHPGYETMMNQNGPLDRVVVFVAGYLNPDVGSDVQQYYQDRPSLHQMVDDYAGHGWDIVIFNYKNPGIDIRHNGENLQNYLAHLSTLTPDTAFVGLWGWSMGNLVVRTALAQASDSMGVDAYVSVDGPHRGMQVSRYARTARQLFLSMQEFPAARQQTIGEEESDELLLQYLPELEGGDFISRVIEPMHTLAITFCDGSKPWEISAARETLHDRFWPVSSTANVAGVAISEFITYHSAALLDDVETVEVSRTGHQRTYRYRSQDASRPSKYFDTIWPFPKSEHNINNQPVAVREAMLFFALHAPADH